MGNLYRFQALLVLTALLCGTQALVVHNCKNGAFSLMKQSRGSTSPRLSKTSQEQEDRETQFDSLDVMLDRARKRNQLPLFLGKCQQVLDRRILHFLSIGDVLIVLAALVLLGAKGFAAGLVIGKATLAPLRKLLAQQENGGTFMKLIEFYPAMLAIVLDQIFRNGE